MPARLTKDTTVVFVSEGKFMKLFFSLAQLAPFCPHFASADFTSAADYFQLTLFAKWMLTLEASPILVWLLASRQPFDMHIDFTSRARGHFPPRNVCRER
eukprot:5279538-Karenia_brevis.AAC.1